MRAVIAERVSFREFNFLPADIKVGAQSYHPGANVAHDQKEDISCQIETEPAQGTRGHNQDRDAEKGKNKKVPVVEEGLKTAPVRDLVGAVTLGVPREPVKKIRRKNKIIYKSLTAALGPAMAITTVWVGRGKEIFYGKNLDRWLQESNG